MKYPWSLLQAEQSQLFRSGFVGEVFQPSSGRALAGFVLSTPDLDGVFLLGSHKHTIDCC